MRNMYLLIKLYKHRKNIQLTKRLSKKKKKTLARTIWYFDLKFIFYGEDTQSFEQLFFRLLSFEDFVFFSNLRPSLFNQPIHKLLNVYNNLKYGYRFFEFRRLVRNIKTTIEIGDPIDRVKLCVLTRDILDVQNSYTNFC